MAHPEHRHGDDDTITITRSVPMTWVLSTGGTVIVSILVWAASQHYGQKAVAEKVEAMSLKLEATTAIVTANNNRTTELIVHVGELRRRVELLEQRRP